MLSEKGKRYGERTSHVRRLTGLALDFDEEAGGVHVSSYRLCAAYRSTRTRAVLGARATRRELIGATLVATMPERNRQSLVLR